VNQYVQLLGGHDWSGRGSEEASRARLRGPWCKFRGLAPILTKRGASLIVKGRLYSTCV